MKKIFLSLIAFAATGIINANVIYTDITDETLASGGSIDINFNGTGNADFSISDQAFGGQVEPGIIFNADNGFVMEGTPPPGTGWDVISGLVLSTDVDASSNFQNIGGDGYIDPFWSAGSFPTTDTYIGATFKIGADTHYGWILVNWNGNGTLIVKSYAYEDTPNKKISTGDTGSTVGIAQLISETQLSIYPNPSVSTLNFNIKSNDSEPVNVKIISTSGSIAKTVNLPNNSSIDVSDLATGSYLLILDNKHHHSVNSFIKE